MELFDYLIDKYGSTEPSDEGFRICLDKIVKYVIAVYTERGSDIIMLNERKEAVILDLGIKNKKDVELLMSNKSNIVSRMVTDVLHITANREFELYISALEAATILLDVVRRPIDDTLEDEKWLSALKAKKQGFVDARELLDNANEIAEKILGAKNVDVEEHVDEVIYKEGLSERLAKAHLKRK